ncbi:MAG: RNA polymerase sigma-54 factor, partial [Burkholderiales bacterium]
ALELEQEVARLLATNPLLERPDDADDHEHATADATVDAAPEAEPGASDTAADDSFADAPEMPTGQSGGQGDEFPDPLLMMPARVSLREHLMQQVNVSALGPQDAAVARLVVEALDEAGYLRDSAEDILAAVAPGLADAAADSEADSDGMVERFHQSFEVALRFVQSLDPTGVGARSVEECLALQLKRHPEGVPGRTLALRIVAECIDLFASRDIAALKGRLGCSEAELGAANTLIRTLAVRPAQAFAAQDHRYVIPEVIVRRKAGKWVVSANPDASPQVRLHRAYASVVRRTRGWSNTAMGGQLNEARWLLKSLRQRADTIVRVADAIVDAQQRWFEHGDIAIRPLFLRDIAARTGLHESTVSRVTAGKYMATPRGVIEFKHFFGSRLAAEDGFRMSSRSIQVLIRDIVAEEDPVKPLSDIRLTRALEQRGVKLARRTVTKYRDATGIPPVEARRLNAMSAPA